MVSAPYSALPPFASLNLYAAVWQPSRNQVGNPFLSYISLAKLSLQSASGAIIPLAAAVSQGIASPLYAFDSGSGVYAPPHTSPSNGATVDHHQ